LIGCHGATVSVRSLDLVSDTTSVDVRYRVPRASTGRSTAATAASKNNAQARTGALQVQR
jgi:hypothetical protein